MWLPIIEKLKGKNTELELKVILDIDEDGSSLRSESTNKSYEATYSDLVWLFKKHGNLIIESANKEGIKLTTADTLKNRENDKKVRELSEIIEAHVKGRAAVGNKVYTVMHDGVLHGVFNTWVMANFKKIELIRKDKEEDDIIIEETVIE